nr:MULTISPECIES: GIY-YIG nuclease family protein [unclassified Salinicola]
MLAVETQRWYLYLIETARGALYTGITTDVARRFAQHEAGKGARALRGKGPLTLVHAEWVGDHGEALRREAAVKRLRAAQKWRWVSQRQAAVGARAGDCHALVIRRREANT